MPAKSVKSTAAKPKKAKATKKTAKTVKAPGTSVTRKKRPAKASAKLPPSFTLEPKKPAHAPVIPHDDIALRAYFIAELRRKMGWPGDSATDWADAEKQLRAEALEKPLKKR